MFFLGRVEHQVLAGLVNLGYNLAFSGFGKYFPEGFFGSDSCAVLPVCSSKNRASVLPTAIVTLAV